MRTIDHLIEAAQVAKRAFRPMRAIEILITDAGFMVRGKTLVAGEPAVSNVEYPWPKFQHRPEGLVEAVRRVDDALAKAEGGEP